MKFLLNSGLFIFILDLIIISLHLLLGSQYFVFHLDYEHNIPTVFQALKLMGIAQFFFLYIYSNSLVNNIKKKELLYWVPMVIVFLFLAIDELGQIHENLHGYISQLFPSTTMEYTDAIREQGFISSDWLILYIPLFIIFIIFLYIFIRHLYKYIGISFLLLVVGTAIILTVPFIEFINTSGIDEGLYYSLMTLEEFLEMIGISFFFVFAYQNYRKSRLLLNKIFNNIE